MDKEIIQLALENLHQAAGIKAFWKSEGPIDGTLEFFENGQKYRFEIEVKGELRSHQIHRIEEHYKGNQNFMLLAKYILPKVKEELRQIGIPYLEGNGNVFIKKNGLFFYVDTKSPLARQKSKGNRAFTKTGLKVLFFLLQHKEAINWKHRELASKTQVGLGNIPQIIDGLKKTGYLMSLDQKNYAWENRKELLNRWISEYATTLRPGLLKEKYKLNGDWQSLKFEPYKTVWGGEPAADLLTNYLRPEKFILYTKESRMEIMKNYNFKADKFGDVEVIEMFWVQEKGRTAPAILVYADLILEGGKRNKETADRIYHEHIQPIL